MQISFGYTSAMAGRPRPLYSALCISCSTAEDSGEPLELSGFLHRADVLDVGARRVLPAHLLRRSQVGLTE